MQTNKSTRATSPNEANSIRSLLLWLIGLTLLAGIIYGLIASNRDPITTLNIFSTRFLGIFIEAAPFLLLGAVVSGLLEVYVSREDIVRWMPKNPVLATIAGTFMGFVFPVCECGVVPVTRRLFTKGLPMSVGVAFLLAAPVMNPIVLVSTYIAFGWGPVLISRFVFTAVVAVAVGIVFAVAARPQEILRPVSFATVRGGSSKAGKPDDELAQLKEKPLIKAPPTPPTLGAAAPAGFLGGIFQAMRVANDEVFEMGRYLVIGCLLAAAMQTLVSQEVLLSLGEGPLVSVIVMQLVAFVISVCSTVDSFLALAFYGTFTGGSIVAFLTFGPMVDIKSALMFAGVFRRKVVFYLILLPFLMTMLIGLWLNLFVAF